MTDARGRSHAGFVLAGVLLGLLALGPGLRRGFLLSYDMVFVPRPPFNAAMFGLAGSPPRAVPSDFVVALLARVLASDIVEKMLLIIIFALACSGAAALLRDERWPARLAAGVCYAWNPFVAERLIIGQWALLLGYGGLPWALRALTTHAASRWRWAGRLALALVPAAVGGFSAMCVSALVVLPVAWLARACPAGPCRRERRSGGMDRKAEEETIAELSATTTTPRGALRATRSRLEACGTRPTANLRERARSATLALSVLVLLSLPWLIPALAGPVLTGDAGVAAFAARADTPFGSVGSLLMLGGIWNGQAVPAGYGGASSVVWLAVMVAAYAFFVRAGRRRWPGLGVAAAAGLALACVGLTASGRTALGTLIALWSGFAVLRDAQQFVAPLALAGALGAGLAVAALMRSVRPLRGMEGRATLGAIVVIAPVVLLPGLAWGAAGRLSPVWYPADWMTASALINGDHTAGRVLLLPWAAYRRFGWNNFEAVLDPWPRLLRREVVWNDGVQVGAISVPPESPLARDLTGLIYSRAPMTGPLMASGFRYVIVDAGQPNRPAQPGGSRWSAATSYRSRLPGCRLIVNRPDLLVYQLPLSG